MNALDTSSSTSRDAPKQFSAIRLPIEEPIDDLEDAIETLRACSAAELRRARQHHRRAIESLREGGYDALSEDTRDNLLAHLRSNLEALNRALDGTASRSPNAEEDSDSLSARFRAFVQGLW